jgi:clathrin heavy chain
VKVFDLSSTLRGCQITNYRSSPDGEWVMLMGSAPGPPQCPLLRKGHVQLFGVSGGRSRAFDAHAACFATLTHSGNPEASLLLVFTDKQLVDGAPEAKLTVVELGTRPGSVPFVKNTRDVFWPHAAAVDDFAVGMQVSDALSLVYVVTQHGLLFVHDLASGATLCSDCISADDSLVFLTMDAPATGGIFAINRAGQVLLVNVVRDALVPFILDTLLDLELALSVAQRGQLPGADKLAQARFAALLEAEDYAAAAADAAASPRGLLRTREVMAKFADAPTPADASSAPLIKFLGACLAHGRLNAHESLRLAQLVVGQQKHALLPRWLADDKLECSEALGDLIRPLDAALALGVYLKARVDVPAVTGLAARGELGRLAAYLEQTGHAQAEYSALMCRVMAVSPAAALALAAVLATRSSPVMDAAALVDMLASSGARAAPHAASAPATGVPADLAALLAELSLSEFGPALVGTLGTRSLSAALFVHDADLVAIGMKPVERRSFLAAVAQSGGAGGAAPAACSSPRDASDSPPPFI